MKRFSMNELTTYRWSFDEDLLRFRDAGYDAVGVWLQKLHDFGEDRAIELLRDTGLRVSSVAWVGGFTGSDATSASQNLALARDALALCSELGAGCLIVHSGGRNGHTRRHAVRLFRSAIDALLPFAEEFDVPLAIEPMAPQCAGEWTLVNDLGKAVEFVEGYRSGHLQLAIDTYHFPTAVEDSLASRVADHLAVLHVGDLTGAPDADQRRVPLGRGSANLHGVVASWIRAGYAGPLEAKLLGAADGAGEYYCLLEQSLCELRALSESPVVTPSSAITLDATRSRHQRSALDSPKRDPILLRP